MKRRLQEIAENYGIALIYLFGSRAKEGKEYLEGKSIVTDLKSDLDIAVVFKNIEYIDVKIYASIYKDLSLLFDKFEIDLIFMHEHSPLFQYEIIKGYKVYSADDEFADSFEESIIKQAEDLAFKRDEFYKDIMEAIEDGYIEFEYNPYNRAD